MSNVVSFGKAQRQRRQAMGAERQVFSVEEVSVMLDISLSGTYQYLRDGEIPGRKIGGRWVVPRKRFLHWLEDLEGDDGLPTGIDPDDEY